MAKRFDIRVVSIEKNPESVAIATENIRAAGLEGQVEIVEGDIFRFDAISEQFDYVLAEAILTMQSQEAKIKILQGVRDRLKPEGKFFCFSDLSRALSISSILNLPSRLDSRKKSNQQQESNSIHYESSRTQSLPRSLSQPEPANEYHDLGSAWNWEK
jgi:predicted RNA methylase